MVSNLVQLFFEQAKENAARPALVLPRNGRAQVISFQDLRFRVQSVVSGLTREGIGRGERIFVLLPVSQELYISVLALMAVGAVPIFADPKMGRSRFLSVVQQLQPKLVLTKKSLSYLRLLLPGLRARKWIPFENLQQQRPVEIDYWGQPDFQASVLFSTTSGTTGVPKIIHRTFGPLLQQHLLSRKYWPETESEVDMTCFPNIVFQNLCSGATSVLPPLGPQGQLDYHPQMMREWMLSHRVSRFSCSPAFVENMDESRDWSKLPVQRILVGGAPVGPALAKKCLELFPGAESHVLYGSTEVEPIAFGSMRELSQKEAHGYWVGRPLKEVKIFISETDSFSWNDLKTMGSGELVLTSPHVIEDPTKWRSAAGETYHRTSDLAEVNSQGEIVILGRKGQVWNNTPFHLIEQEIEHHAGVKKSGCIVSKERLHIFIEGSFNENDIRDRLAKFSADSAVIRPCSRVPRDLRHNSRVDRDQLRNQLFS